MFDEGASVHHWYYGFGTVEECQSVRGGLLRYLVYFESVLDRLWVWSSDLVGN